MDLHDVSQYPGFLMPPEVQKKVKAALAAYPNVIPLLVQAAACPEYDTQFDYTLPPEQTVNGEFLTQYMDVVQKCRSAARVLYARAMLLAAEGNGDEAVETGVTILRLAAISIAIPR